MKALKTSILAVVFCTLSMGAAAQKNWPYAISLPAGLEAEGITLGKGHEFFVGGFSFSSAFSEAFFGLPPVELPESAGAIYKGNLRTGEVTFLAKPQIKKPVSGLSYDHRTNYLYAATGFLDFVRDDVLDPPLVSGTFIAYDQGVIVYDASSGEVIMKIGFGDGISINDVLVTRKAVYFTDSFNPWLWKLPLEKGGRLPSNPMVEMIPMPGFVMADPLLPLGQPQNFNANGLVGKFDGKQLVIVNITTGVLYRVDTASGEATPIEIEGDEQLFENGDGLYLDGRTLYIMQNFLNKIAVVKLSKDLSRGKFIKNLPGEDEDNPLDIATSIIGFGNSIYALNTNFFDLIFGNPAEVQAEVVRLKKKSKKSKK